jgi:molybdate transport system permease protein
MIFTELERFAILFSLKVALVSVLLAVPMALFLSYILINYRFRGKAVLENLFNLPLVLPPVVTGYLLLVLLNRNSLIGSLFETVFESDIAFAYPGAVIAATVVSFPLVLRPVKLAMQAVDQNYVLISRSLGVSKIRTFFKIVIPLSKSGIIAGAILGFARSIGEFGATIMLAGNIPFKTTTMPLAIFSSFNSAGGEPATIRLVIISIIISFIAMIISELFIRRNKNV